MSEFSECLSYFIKEGKTDTALLEERTGVPCSVIASFLKGKEAAGAIGISNFVA